MSQAFQIAFLSAALGVVAWAQAKPDFSGAWKLNIEETDFPGGPKPSPSTFSAVRTVQQRSKDIRLKIENNRNGKKGGFDFVTIPIAGEPHVSDEAGIITAEWQGETLHFHYLYNPGTDRQSERTEDWTLSADGKKLVDQEVRTQADGKELRYKIVFDKQ